jgi:hypothetical protein
MATRRRRSEAAGLGHTRRTPPARVLSRLTTVQREQLAKTDAMTVVTIETGVAALAIACGLLDRFQRTLRTRDADARSPWITDTENGLLAAIGRGIRADFAATKAALSEPWSNG